MIAKNVFDEDALFVVGFSIGKLIVISFNVVSVNKLLNLQP